jgi:hypothetical protein
MPAATMSWFRDRKKMPTFDEVDTTLGRALLALWMRLGPPTIMTEWAASRPSIELIARAMKSMFDEEALPLLDSEPLCLRRGALHLPAGARAKM